MSLFVLMTCDVKLNIAKFLIINKCYRTRTHPTHMWAEGRAKGRDRDRMTDRRDGIGLQFLAALHQTPHQERSRSGAQPCGFGPAAEDPVTAQQSYGYAPRRTHLQYRALYL